MTEPTLPEVDADRQTIPENRAAAVDTSTVDVTAPVADAAPPSMTLWGRRAALWYLLVGALALVAMLVETVLGHPGTGTMFAAILAAPWSMLVAGMAPPLPRDWPMAAGLAVRMVPLLLFMLLNALIVASIAARSERDLKGGTPRALLLLVLAGLLGSGCGLTSEQVVVGAAPAKVTEVFNGGSEIVLLEFDLSQVPEWQKHRGHIQAALDVSLMGDFTNPADGPFIPAVPVDIELSLSPTAPMNGFETAIWKGLHLVPGETHRVSWDEGARHLQPEGDVIRAELSGDGQFTIVLRSFGPPFTATAATVDHFRLGAVLQVK